MKDFLDWGVREAVVDDDRGDVVNVLQRSLTRFGSISRRRRPGMIQHRGRACHGGQQVSVASPDGCDLRRGEGAGGRVNSASRQFIGYSVIMVQSGECEGDAVTRMLADPVILGGGAKPKGKLGSGSGRDAMLAGDDWSCRSGQYRSERVTAVGMYVVWPGFGER